MAVVRYFAIEENVDIAIATLKDYLIKVSLDKSNAEDLKLAKLLVCRERNPRFEYELAEMICGEEGNPFPYRSSYYLTEFFKSLGFKLEHDGTTRRFWTEKVLKGLDIKELAVVIRKGLFNRRDFRKYASSLNEDFETLYRKAIQEFQLFIHDSISDAEELDLASLLEMNVNTEILFNDYVTTEDKELNNLIEEAKKRFLVYSDKQIALEKIWDAFERIKTYFDSDKRKSAESLVNLIAVDIAEDEFTDEFKRLTKIGNTYRIRHHEVDKREINDDSQVDYLFFRVLSLINLCVKRIEQSTLMEK
jgi:hypothetical protein